MLNELGILELRTFGFFSCFFAVISFIKYLLYFLGSIVYVISAPMSPIFGLLVDKTGKNLIWVLCAVVKTTGSGFILPGAYSNATCHSFLSYKIRVVTEPTPYSCCKD